VLGPEPVIGAQAVTLTSAAHPGHEVRIATDGLRPFTAGAATP
jgi:general secretion pathway protein H